MTVFDHCDPDTETIIEAALEETRRLGHGYLGTEHLLLALVQHRELLPQAVQSLLPALEALRSTLTKLLGISPRRDTELLKVVGVDLDEVRTAVRRTFGSEAIERLGRRRVHQPWQPWRRPSRRCTSLLAGTMSVAPHVKQALELAREHALRRQRAVIDPGALLAGMIGVEGAFSNHLLRGTGADTNRIRRRLDGST